MWCKECQLWQALESDLFCSWCGITFIDLALTIDTDYLYVGDPATSLKLTIRHTGALGAVELHSVASDPEQPWLKIKADQQAKTLPGKSLRSGQFIELTLEAELADLPVDYNKAKITVASSVGLREAVIEAVPKPKLDKVSTGGQHTILLDNLQEERLTGYLAISGGVVTVSELRTDSAWADVIAVNQSIPCRLDARSNKRLEFEFKIDEMRLFQEIQARGETFPVERTGNLIMKFEQMEPERSWQFQLKCLRPPKLIIPEAEGMREIEAFVGRRAEFSLTLQNGKQGELGHADLQISKIDPDVQWIQPTTKISYPLTISSGQYQHITFAVSAENQTPGNRQAQITSYTNIPGPEKQYNTFVEVHVREMATFDGVLAIDFGTTNSCCAYLDRRGRQELIFGYSDGDAKATTVSSAILYKNLLQDGNKDYEIGNNAYEYSFLGGIYSRCTVKQVKRWLGREKSYEIRFSDDTEKTASYSPREIATDVFRRILKTAEERLKKRVKACTVSHPARFSVRQIDDLKAAVVACGIEESEISLVPEPVAAALDYIRGEVVREKYPEYHLMVFDFGGGTTDVTLMKIVNEKRPGRNLMYVKPDVLGIAGDPSFGGENVTDTVLTLIHAKCEQHLRQKNESAARCIVPIREEQFEDPRFKVLARRNRAGLRQRAESIKIAISLYGDNHLNLLDEIWKKGKSLKPQAEVAEASRLRTTLTDNFTLGVIVDNAVVEAYGFTQQLIAPLKEDLDVELRPKLVEIVESMKRLAEKRGVSPKIILLSGKSSSLPLVKDVISEGFPEAIFERPLDPKECVVLGACQISEEEPAEGVTIKLESGQRLNAMTSSLGISVRSGLAGRKFKTVIESGEPIGKEGIRRAVENDVDFTRRTRITIYENTGNNPFLVESSGEDNPNITELKTFKLEAKLTQWEREHNKRINDSDVENASIELEVSPNMKVKLKANIPNVDEVFEFEADYFGG